MLGYYEPVDSLNFEVYKNESFPIKNVGGTMQPEILLVEDMRDIRTEGAFCLNEVGKVTACRNVREAERAFRNMQECGRTFFAIVLDNDLGLGKTGLQFAQELREVGYEGTIVLHCGDLQLCENPPGAFTFGIVKPKIDEVVGRLRQFLEV